MSGSSPIRRIAASLVIALTASLALAGPAQADPAQVGPAQVGPAQAGLTQAGPIETRATPLSCWTNADTNEQQCFPDNFSRDRAIVQQTGFTARAATSDLTVTAGVSTAAATYILAIFYWTANYADSTWVITTGYASLCSAYSYSNNITGGWDNQIGSFKSYGTCKTRLSENAGQSGSSYGPVKNGPTLGYLNDKASSYYITD